jgi:hypothetical protein
VLVDLAAVHDLGEKLDAMGIPWVVVGSIASSLLGEPRATADVDIVTDLRGSDIHEFCGSLAEAYYVDEETARWAATTRRSFNVIHHVTITKVDIFCCKADPLSRAQLQRRSFHQISGHSTPFLAPEDAILQKLHWLEELGSADQQWRDALGVLRMRWDVLDREYLQAQARDHGLDALLSKLLAAREPS